VCGVVCVVCFTLPSSVAGGGGGGGGGGEVRLSLTTQRERAMCGDTWP